MAKNYNQSNKVVQGLSVKVQNNNFEKAMRQWKRKVSEDGRIQEYRDRQEFIGKSERKREQRKQSRRRAQRQNMDMNQPADKLY